MASLKNLKGFEGAKAMLLKPNGSKPNSAVSEKEIKVLSLEEKIEKNLPYSDGDKKIFVIDTNILINDPTSPYNFGNNIKVIAFSTIGKELNNVAKNTRRSSTRYAATEAKRTLHDIIDKGVDQGVDFSVQPVCLGKGDHDLIYLMGDTSLKKRRLKIDSDLGTGDLNILNTAKFYNEIGRKKGYQTVLVTNDLSLASLAGVNDITAEDVKRGSVDLDKITKGYHFCTSDEAISEAMKYMDKSPRLIPFERVSKFDFEDRKIAEIPHNSYVIFVGSDKDYYKKVDSKDEVFGTVIEDLPNITYRVDKKYGVLKEIKYKKPYLTIGALLPKNLQQYIFMNDCIDDDINVVVGHGLEGSGKTYVGLAASVHLAERYLRDLDNKEDFTKPKQKNSGSKNYETYSGEIEDIREKLKGFIRLSKPILHPEELGYQPGDIDDKVRKDYGSFTGAIESLWECKSSKNPRGKISYSDFEIGNSYNIINYYKDLKDITESKDSLFKKDPTGFLRGANRRKGVWIIDEFQNKYPWEARLFITRVEDSVKVIICGGEHQVDSRYLRDNYNALATIIDYIQKTNTSDGKRGYNSFPFTNSVEFKHIERGKTAEWGTGLDAEEYKNR